MLHFVQGFMSNRLLSNSKIAGSRPLHQGQQNMFARDFSFIRYIALLFSNLVVNKLLFISRLACCPLSYYFRETPGL